MTRHGASKQQRGFTLIELMITVAIIGVLAMLAVLGYSRWIRSSKTAEATSMVSSIKGQQDTYRAETLKYLDCAGTKSLTVHYPSGAPSATKQTFDTSACGGDLVCASFKKLNVTADKQVYYVYSCAAGPADGTNVTSADTGRIYGTANDTWNIVRAVGNLNGDAVTSLFESSSLDSTIWSKNSEE